MYPCRNIHNLQSELDRVESLLQDIMLKGEPDMAKGGLYLLKAGGKRLRPSLALLSAGFGQPTERVITFAAAVEMIHMASLVHDDLLDEAGLRRGRPTVDQVYGFDYAVYLGDYLLAGALLLIDKCETALLHHLVAKTTLGMCLGEVQQYRAVWETPAGCLDYLLRIRRKTALLMSLSCCGGAVVAGVDKDAAVALQKFGLYVGMSYQIIDDILDYTADEKTLGKPVGRDLQKGIISLPLVYLLKQDSAGQKKLYRLLARREKLAPRDVAFIRQMVVSSDAITYCQRLAERYIEKALNALGTLPEQEEKRVLRHITGKIKDELCKTIMKKEEMAW